MDPLAFGSGVLVCPFCESGGLRPHRLLAARCDLCDRTVETAVLKTMEQIAALPDALGKHACECGHPEMRRLPDGVLHCPACGAEVTPPVRGSGPAAPRGRLGAAREGRTDLFAA